jgi:DNA adenine methylase
MFVEPFAGGAIISLTVAAEQLADNVLIVELDPWVAAVWETIICDDGGGEWLAETIVSFDLRLETVQAILASTPQTVREQAFQTILRNRVNRGGIMAPGAGLIKTGEAGKGLRSRWYPETLRKRILDIVAIRERTTFVHSDGLTLLRKHAEKPDAVFFIDPPYTASKKRAGSRLYTLPDVNHQQLFKIADALAGDFLMTYDDAEEVRLLAQVHGFDIQPVVMKNTHHAKMNELLIGRNLDWLR